MTNLIIYTSPSFPQPDRERTIILDSDPDRARKIWAAADEVQRIQGMPLRTARLIIDAKAKERHNGKRIEKYYDQPADAEFRRLSIRFQTATQEDQFFQFYSEAKTLVCRAFESIKREGIIHDVPVTDAYLEEGGEMLRSGIVDHAKVIDEWHSKIEEKKRWR